MPEPTTADDRSKAGKRSPSIWFRVLLSDGALGPGKISLMRLVEETGSVSQAAKRLRMSHARSVKLVAELNQLHNVPLIETRSGGERGGGAALTALGRLVLEIHDALEADLRTAAAPHLRRLERGDADE